MYTRFVFTFIVLIVAFSLGTRAQERVSPERSAATPPATAATNPEPQNSSDPKVESTTPPSTRSALPNKANALTIGPGDLLEVAVYGAPDYDKMVRVSDSGAVSLPLLGSVTVGGMSPSQAERLLATQFGDRGLFNNPQVSVFIREYATQGISVLGEVQKPGIYSLMGPRSVLDAISAAGGATPKAGDKATVTHRSDPQHPVTVKYSSEGGVTSILPGDTVVISKAGMVYVVGDVHLPGGFIAERNPITVLEALSMAQGTNPTASLSHAKIIRRSGGSPSEIPVNLNSILSAKAPDVPLTPDDILFVPSSKAKSAAHRTLEAIIQAATGVAVYRP